MLKLYVEHRGVIDSTLVLLFACYLPFAVTAAARRQSAERAKSVTAPAQQHVLVTAANEVGAVGVGILWTMLLYLGPSFSQLSHGAGRVSPWLCVLLYTMMWLTMSRVTIAEHRPQIVSAVVARAIVYGLFFLLAATSLNGW
jgi:hypothetical protein